MALRHYQELIVWQRAMDLAEAVYKATRSFPREEIYGLTSQLRRSAVSVASNIAEGQGRGGTGEFLNFCKIAQGSLQEVETQLLLAERLELIDADQTGAILEISAEVSRLNHGLMKKLMAKKSSH